MKEHVQKTGVRKYAGDDLIELQSEPLKAIQRFFEECGICVIQGCEVSKSGSLYNVAPGVVALSGTDAEGNDAFKVVPFSGVENVSLPIYLTLTHTVVERAYADQKVKPIAYNYMAVASGVRPADGVSFLEITPAGGRRFVDAVKITEKLDKVGNGKDVTVTFAQASDQANVASGDKLSVLFGKVRKWFSALGNLAFKNTATIAEVDHLQTTLDTKANKSSLGALASKDVVAISEVTNLQSTLDAKANSSSLSNYIPLSQKGANSGVATLDASGKVVTSQLPLGETAATAYRGDRGKIAYDYSQGIRQISEINGLENRLTPVYDNYKYYYGVDDLGCYLEFARIEPFQTIGQIRMGKDGSLNSKDIKIVLDNDLRLSDARPANGGKADRASILDVSPGENRTDYGSGLMMFQAYDFDDAPRPDWMNYIRMLHNNSAGYFSEIATSFTGGFAEMYFRMMENGVASPWKKVATTEDISSSYYRLDVGGDTSHYYPCTWVSTNKTADISIHSQGTGGADPYNQNILRCHVSACGWGDMPRHFDISESSQFDTNEITIHSIWMGEQNGLNAIYLRGGLTYHIESNVILEPQLSGATLGEEVYNVMAGDGTADNTNVTRAWIHTDGSSFVQNNNGNQTINGNLNLNTPGSSYINLQRNGVNKGYVGCGASATTDVYLLNYGGGNNIKISDNGKNYSNDSEIATVDQIPTRTDQIAETTNKKYVTDTEKATWNSKAPASHTHPNYAPLSHTHPGNILCSGKVAKEGGAYFITGGFSIQRIGKGTYKIGHSIGHTNYGFIGTGFNSSEDMPTFIGMKVCSAYHCEVCSYWGNSGFQDSEFSFTIFAR